MYVDLADFHFRFDYNVSDPDGPLFNASSEVDFFETVEIPGPNETGPQQWWESTNFVP